MRALLMRVSRRLAQTPTERLLVAALILAATVVVVALLAAVVAGVLS